MTNLAPTYDCLRAAGKNPEVMHSKRLLIAGGGNAGSNAVLSASVLGIDTGFVDMDTVEPRNLPHSPFLDATPNPDGARPWKAELLAKAHVENARRPEVCAFWAPTPIQGIPLGVLRRFDALLVGIDDGPSRAWAVRAAATLGIPSVVAGFYPPGGNFVATSNRDPEAPCYFCLRPHETPNRASCALYSDPDGRVNPALQTATAATMNVALEAITRFWHGDLRYDAKVFRLDLGDGTAGLTGFRRNPDCMGPHEALRQIVEAPFAPDATAAEVLNLARRDGLTHPVLELPSPFVASLPCRLCGADVPIGVPDWSVRSAPSCEGGCGKPGTQSGTLVEENVAEGSALQNLSLSTLGLGPLGLCIIEDGVTGELRAYELPGSLHMVFRRIERQER